MNWYARLKHAQFVDFQGLVNAIAQRLKQSEGAAMANENAFDDIHAQGFDLNQIETAIVQALSMYMGPGGNEAQLNDSQRHLIATLRGQQAISPDVMEQDPMQQMGDQLNNV